ncbi:haloacid dehalogenase [Planotetraspora thailandica]|uniref:Haloacid dehalogenase n=1 Tax=Planotetraspora thailandica TaxID=487172 RepID=A0A8J3Y0J6_9ACTN|nr:HAD family phosphatase [Planotetraspora thailandica]GII58628.1 haloacid dehalogenase [Planotetraspora thailandica]
MAVKAVVFDIGGVLEIDPPLGVSAKWEEKLGLEPGEINRRAGDLWRDGAVGAVSEEEVHQGLAEIFALDAATVDAFMADIWVQYLGTLNEELAAYATSLRPRYRTAILSNSFVGAREKEQAAYGFGELVDFIVYSHEVGMSKPDRRIYELTCERLGVLPEETVFLDDVEAYVEGAREAGIHAVLFKDNAQAISEIDALLR